MARCADRPDKDKGTHVGCAHKNVNGRRCNAVDEAGWKFKYGGAGLNSRQRLLAKALSLSHS